MSPKNLVLFHLLLMAPFAWAQNSDVIQLTTQLGGQARFLKSFSLSELRNLKPISRVEKDPATSQPAKWEGLPLSEVLGKVTSELSIEESSSFDLLILSDAHGKKTPIPRSFVQKYPLLLTWSRNGEGLGSRGPFMTVVPWTSQEAKVKAESLPLPTYFVEGVQTIELTNYQIHYSSNFFISRRTDPFLLRGEKRFVQNCVACHSDPRWFQRADSRGLAQIPKAHAESAVHQNLEKNLLQISSPDQEAIFRYIREIKKQEASRSTS